MIQVIYLRSCEKIILNPLTYYFLSLFKIINNPEITEIFIHDLLITEIFYVFCRQKNKEYAEKVVSDLLSMTTMISSENLRLIAGRIKCD